MGTVGTGTLHHTCYVVHDIEKTARALSDSSSIGPWSVWTIDVPEATVRGEPASFSFRVALAELGGSSIELLEPVSGEAVYAEHLAKHGEGFHHTCLAYPSHEEMLAAKADLLGQGFEMVQNGVVGDAVEFAYFEVPALGSLLELLYLGELPPPEATIG